MKFCILKPIAWNDNGYKAPCGALSAGDNFVNDNGYGHEEWNNTPGMKHEGRAYFHSEAKDALAKKAQGNMCILLIAAYESENYIVGAAAGVTANKKEDIPSIAKTLNIYEKWKEIWALPLVQEKFKGNKKDFMEHWKKHYQWINWSCPEYLFHWFSKPILFDPKKVTEKKYVIKMFSGWQYVSPAIVLDLLDGALPAKHPIFEWLLDGDFEEGSTTPNKDQTGKYSKKKNSSGRKGSNRPTEMLYEYWVEGKRTAHPRHSTLQDAFVLHLKSQGITCEQNTPDYIDLMYMDKKKLVITEVKPAESVGTKYAIRAAVGQLFEYRHTISEPTALLHIVLDEKPKKNEVKFVQSLGFILSYKDKSGKFITLINKI
jgi:hypothetical protein